jgi:hypothetical protein
VNGGDVCDQIRGHKAPHTLICDGHIMDQFVCLTESTNYRIAIGWAVSIAYPKVS